MMIANDFVDLPFELKKLVQRRTGWRVHDLVIELHPGRAHLRGRATTYLARHLAQHVVKEYLPELDVENAIQVDNPVEILPGMPLN
jgi:hypothetical protein